MNSLSLTFATAQQCRTASAHRPLLTISLQTHRRDISRKLFAIGKEGTPPFFLTLWTPKLTNNLPLHRSRPHALSASAELGIPYTMPGSTSAGSYPRTISPASSPGRDDQQVRVLNSRPKPQCWDHGCNGRQFSTFSNLLRHQREKSGAAAKSECPHCGIVFTRTTARNGHLAQGKCKGRRGSMG